MSNNQLIALVTGANQGIGLQTTRALCAKGYHVIMACRDKRRAREAIQDWSVAEQQQISILALDLADLESVTKFARKVSRKFKHIDALILNAGVSPDRYQKTAQGLELAFGVNHLGHFYLTHLLLPLVKNAPSDGRIVVLSSSAQAVPDLSNLQRRDLEATGAFSSIQKVRLYSETKGMNILFTKHLAATLRAENSNVTINAVHPGFVQTSMSGSFVPGLGFLWRTAVKIFSKSATDGAKTSIYVATSPSVAGVSGEYFVDKSIASLPTKQLADPQLASDFWNASLKILADLGYAL